MRHEKRTGVRASAPRTSTLAAGRRLRFASFTLGKARWRRRGHTAAARGIGRDRQVGDQSGLQIVVFERAVRVGCELGADGAQRFTFTIGRHPGREREKSGLVAGILPELLLVFAGDECAVADVMTA